MSGTGILITRKREKQVATSKIVKGAEKIEKNVTEGYQKIEDTVVGSYKKMEDTITGGYTKLEDKFVDAFLTKDGETVEEAKERLKKETSV